MTGTLLKCALLQNGAQLLPHLYCKWDKGRSGWSYVKIIFEEKEGVSNKL